MQLIVQRPVQVTQKMLDYSETIDPCVCKLWRGKAQVGVQHCDDLCVMHIVLCSEVPMPDEKVGQDCMSVRSTTYPNSSSL